MEDQSQKPEGSAQHVEDSVQDASGVEATQSNLDDFVALETYRKAVSREKRLKQELEKARQENSHFKEEKMVEEGKHTDVIAALRKELEEQRLAVKEKDEVYGWERVSTQFHKAAMAEGCAHPDKLMKLIDQDDFASVEVDSNYKVNIDDVKRVIEKAKKENEFLFARSARKVDDLPPSDKIEKKQPKPLSEMSLEQKLKMLKHVT